MIEFALYGPALKVRALFNILRFASLYLNYFIKLTKYLIDNPKFCNIFVKFGIMRSEHNKN